MAPSNGLYRFYIRSDDAAQLYMNTNAVNSTDPAGAVLLGQLNAFTSAYTLLGQNVPLVGGQSYYIEARWKDGTGGDGIAMAFRAQSDAAAFPSVRLLTWRQRFLRGARRTDRCWSYCPDRLTPASPALSEGQTVTFLRRASPARNRTRSPGSRTVRSWAAARPIRRCRQCRDNNAVYTLVVSNLFSSAQASATVTVTTDTTPPTVTAVTSHSFLRNVIVTFSEPVNRHRRGTRALPDLGSLSGGVRGSRVAPRFSRRLRKHPEPHVVTVGNIRDVSTAENQMTAASIPFNAWQATGCEVGALLTEVFTNMTGVNISDLTGNGFANNIVDTLGTSGPSSGPPFRH